MKGIFRKLTVAVVMICAFLVSAMPVCAGTSGVYASRLIATYVAYVEPSDISGELYVYANVDTLHVCEELEVVYLDLYEQQDNGRWLVVETWSEHQDDNDMAYVYGYYQGEIGRSYKVEAKFRAKKGSIEETRTFESSSMICE